MGVCRVRALIPAPLPQVWEFLIKPENMHLWGPPTRPVTGFDRPFEAGDRVTFYRRDFFRNYSQMLQWLDRWLINPVFQLVTSYKTNKVFRRLQAILAKPHTMVSS